MIADWYVVERDLIGGSLVPIDDTKESLILSETTIQDEQLVDGECVTIQNGTYRPVACLLRTKKPIRTTDTQVYASGNTLMVTVNHRSLVCHPMDINRWQLSVGDWVRVAYDTRDPNQCRIRLVMTEKRAKSIQNNRYRLSLQGVPKTLTVIGTLNRVGQKRKNGKQTVIPICLTDVRVADNASPPLDHLWIKMPTHYFSHHELIQQIGQRFCITGQKTIYYRRQSQGLSYGFGDVQAADIIP